MSFLSYHNLDIMKRDGVPNVAIFYEESGQWYMIPVQAESLNIRISGDPFSSAGIGRDAGEFVDEGSYSATTLSLQGHIFYIQGYIQDLGAKIVTSKQETEWFAYAFQNYQSGLKKLSGRNCIIVVMSDDGSYKTSYEIPALLGAFDIKLEGEKLVTLKADFRVLKPGGNTVQVEGCWSDGFDAKLWGLPKLPWSFEEVHNPNGDTDVQGDFDPNNWGSITWP